MKWNEKPFSYLALLALLLIRAGRQGYGQVELRYEQNETVSWEEAIRMYEWMDQEYEEASLVEMGMTDAGKALQH